MQGPISQAQDGGAMKKLAILLFVAALAALTFTRPGVRDELAWRSASRGDQAAHYARYLQNRPAGRHAAEARERYDQRAWAGAGATGTRAAFEQYLQNHADGRHAVSARNEIERLHWADVQAAGTASAYQRYLDTYPRGRFAAVAVVRKDSLLSDDAPYLAVRQRPSREALERFMGDYPGHAREDSVRAILRDMAGRDLVDLLEEDKVEVRARGAGIEEVSLEIRRRVDYEITVKIEVGTYFVARNAAAQNMVATEALTVELETEASVEVEVSAACANRPRDVPGSDDTFSIRRSSAQADLRRLMPVLASSGSGYEVRQAAVWIVTDDADYEDLGVLVSGSAFWGSRLINELEAAAAMRILHRAGIDVRRKAIWRDRAAILAGLQDGELKDWLRQHAAD
jgi:hypothetical protein